MQGYSGTFSLNGVSLILPPSNTKWIDMGIIGEDGYGRPIYPSITEYEMSWDLMSTDALKQMNDAYIFSSYTGTVVVDLPKWGDTGYLFYSYSGTFVNRANVGTYFETYVQDVKVLISNIRVE